MADQNKPLGLTSFRRQTDDKVAAMLKDWLKRARAGELQGVILMGVSSDGANERACAGTIGDANAVYLANQVIYDGIMDSRERETQLPAPEPDDGEDDGEDDVVVEFQCEGQKARQIRFVQNESGFVSVIIKRLGKTNEGVQVPYGELDGLVTFFKLARVRRNTRERY